MATITVSDAIAESFEELKAQLNTIYAPKKLTDDEIMEAMVGGFFDSLEHMKKDIASGDGHHHHDDHECCGGGSCGNNGGCGC